MNRVSKAILWSLAGLVVLMVGLVLGLNLYIQSPGTQTRIQEELSKALKLPLQITSISVTPWSDLRINGIRVPGPSGNFLEAASFSASYQLLPLLNRRLVISEMRMESPKVVWMENAEGKWVLPELPKELEAEKKVELSKPVEEKSSEQKKKHNFAVEFDGFKINNATIEFIDREQKPVAALHNLNLHYGVPIANKVEGSFTLECLTGLGNLSVENLHSSFKYADGELVFPELEGGLNGGTLNGALTCRPDVRNIPFSAGLKFDRVDAARLSVDTGWNPGQVAGTITGQLQVNGHLRQLKRAIGDGNLVLSDGLVRQVEPFQTLGLVLQMEELSNLQLKIATAGFHFADEKAHLDRLDFQALDLKLSAVGSMRFDGKLALEVQLALQPGLAKKLPSFLRETFSETDASGLPAVNFKISGNTDHPKTDLAEKLVGKKLGDQFENLVSGLFGGKKKPDEEEKKKEKDSKKKKKKKEESAVPPAEVVAPAEVPVSAPPSLPSPSVPAASAPATSVPVP